MKTAIEASSTERVPTVYHRIAPCLYLLALILIVVPLVDAAVSITPFRPRNVQWRFGAIGLFTNTLLTPGVGVMIAVVTAAVMQHVRAQRLLAILSWIGVVVLLGMLVVFGLDALQTRALVRPEMMRPFVLASTVAACKLILWMIAFIVFARASRVPPSSRRSAESPAQSMLIRDAQTSAAPVRS
ncbi:MAG: hypothetical protein M3Z10_01385 [Gemmatimonadota bacterium]|nr:hypothetical protein [Gemmatimonadota bacterium]